MDYAPKELLNNINSNLDRIKEKREEEVRKLSSWCEFSFYFEEQKIKEAI